MKATNQTLKLIGLMERGNRKFISHYAFSRYFVYLDKDGRTMALGIGGDINAATFRCAKMLVRDHLPIGDLAKEVTRMQQRANIKATKNIINQ